ncbi:MAG: DUF1838 domain-containing protein [Gammaproteobacteria bacterium]|nr:DUF1838 domain-containing protein [Gammaproteobacteria bacterium]
MSNEDNLLHPARRDFLTTAGGLGGALAIGASGVASMTLGGPMAMASALTSSRYGMGPGLKGPYLDLSTGKGNQLAYARIQGDLDFGKPKYFWFKGYLMGVEPHKKVVDLMGTSGFGVIRLAPGPDGSIRRMCREIIVYTDLRSGEVLDEWKNPLTNEAVKAVHVDNDPFNYLIEEFFPAPPKFGGLNQGPPPPRVPFIMPWYQHAGWADMEIHIHLAYPNALQPDKWPRESSGPLVQVSEMFAHHVKVEDLQNPKLTTLDYTGTWNRVTPWLPWMLMDQRPGFCQYACFMGTIRNLDEVLSRSVLDYAEKYYAKYFDAPTEWSEDRSLSSLEHYALRQKPAPVK